MLTAQWQALETSQARPASMVSKAPDMTGAPPTRRSTRAIGACFLIIGSVQAASDNNRAG